jgi:hypothetical protein
MTYEARLGFVIILIFFWATIGIFPWAVAAIRMKGRGALLLLPVVLLSAILAGIAVPLTGARGITGFWISLFTALFGAVIASSAGAVLVPRLLAPDPESPNVRRPLKPRTRQAADPPSTHDP